VRIVGYGGSGNTAEQQATLRRYVLEVAGRERPRICFVPTAVGDQTEGIVTFYERWGGLGELSHLKFFPYPPDDLRALVLAQDVLVVSGGNTANLLAIWRVHGFDRIVREAWEQGVVLTGGSAGMICWYEACVTDSFGPQLEGLRDGLGFLPGSACPKNDAS
jgi:dipeptidase E